MNDRYLIGSEARLGRVSFDHLIDKSELDLYREVGGQHQVVITVLKNEGDVYDLDFSDTKGVIVHGQFRVGPGQVYANLSSPWGMDDFWQELRKIKAELSKERS